MYNPPCASSDPTGLVDTLGDDCKNKSMPLYPAWLVCLSRLLVMFLSFHLTMYLFNLFRVRFGTVLGKLYLLNALVLLDCVYFAVVCRARD